MRMLNCAVFRCAIVGSFFEDQGVGNPTPSIFARLPAGNPATQPNLLDIRMVGGGAFNFTSVDFEAIGGDGNFIFSAFRNGVLQFNVSGLVASSNTFSTFMGPTALIDDLRIGVFTNTGTQINVDNIALSPVPLPPALPLFAAGLGVMGILSRHRKRKAAAAA